MHNIFSKNEKCISLPHAWHLFFFSTGKGVITVNLMLQIDHALCQNTQNSKTLCIHYL